MPSRLQARLASGIVALAILLGAFPAGAQTSDAGGVLPLQNSLQDSIARLNRSLVAVVAVGSGGPMVVGTGFIVSEDGTFVTASHVLRQPPEVRMQALIHDTAGREQPVIFEALLDDAQRDVTVCRIIAGHGMRPPVVPAELAGTSKAAAGTLVVASGFPLAAARPSSHLGIVSSEAAGGHYVEIAAMVNEGESGAPVVRLDDGKVIGMISSVRTASTYAGAAQGVEDQNSGLTLAAPAEWLSALIAKSKQRAPQAR